MGRETCVALCAIFTAFIGCDVGDPCQQAVQRLVDCNGTAPPTFISGCQQNPQWADAILATSCDAPLAGKSEVGIGGWSETAVPAVPETKATRLVIDVASRTLTLFDAQQNVLAIYNASFGRGEYLSSEGKRREGDLRTPRGTYRLFAARASKYKLFMLVSYPNADDARRGLETGLITQFQHDRIVAATAAGIQPLQETGLGGYIGIHGFGTELGFVPPTVQHLHRGFDWTTGCILLTDAEVEILAQSYVPGAVLEIR